MTQPPGGPRATLIEVVGSSAFRLAGPIRCLPPDTIPDANFGIMSEVYDDSVTFHLPLAGRSRRPTGRRALVVAVTYQACTSRLCLTPRTDSVSAAVPRTP
jgi:thiol:disulfide interchange protein